MSAYPQPRASEWTKRTAIPFSVYSIASCTYRPCKSIVPCGWTLLFSARPDASALAHSGNRRRERGRRTAVDPLCGFSVQPVFLALVLLPFHREVVRAAAVAGRVGVAGSFEALALPSPRQHRIKREGGSRQTIRSPSLIALLRKST